VLDCYGSTETGTIAIDGRPLAGVTIEVDGDRRILISSPLGGRRIAPGDVGRIEARRLIVDGRTGGLVDSGGELVVPERVARELRAVPGVIAARVWSEPDDLLGSRLCAEVRVSDPAVDAQVLTRELAARAGRAAVPREVRITLADQEI
jgi:O-succinylbenzoic acid--CoA ligase